MIKRMFVTCAIAAASAAFAMATLSPGDQEARRQARSVHLTWGGLPTNAVEVVGTVKITEEQTNSYFMVIGFDGGYMGLQNVRGEHVGIFSVWDPESNEFNFSAKGSDVAKEKQANVVFAAEHVNVSRFGGEGTGAKTMFGCNWKIGEPVRFRVTAEPYGDDRTLITGYIGNGDGSSETKVASISKLRHGKPNCIRHVYSFVEDFWRNGLSKTLVRRAEFTGFAAKGPDDKEFGRATMAAFTADHNTLMTIDAGPVPGGGFLQTGGDTKNEHVPLRSAFRIDWSQEGS